MICCTPHPLCVAAWSLVLTLVCVDAHAMDGEIGQSATERVAFEALETGWKLAENGMVADALRIAYLVQTNSRASAEAKREADELVRACQQAAIERYVGPAAPIEDADDSSQDADGTASGTESAAIAVSLTSWHPTVSNLRIDPRLLGMVLGLLLVGAVLVSAHRFWRSRLAASRLETRSSGKERNTSSGTGAESGDLFERIRSSNLELRNRSGQSASHSNHDIPNGARLRASPVHA
jgi:hypothetical protein